MSSNLKTLLLSAGLVLALSTIAAAHQGRRFDVRVVSGQLQAQGINTGPSDGAPNVRPYPNAIHNHWVGVPSLGLSTSNLPGFDVTQFVSGELFGYSLHLDWLSTSKWVSPPHDLDEHTHVHLEPLSPGELISITGPNNDADSNLRQSMLLHPNLPFGGVLDIDPVYFLNEINDTDFHVLEFVLRAEANLPGLPVLRPSDSIWVVLAPGGGDNHHAGLFLEEYLAENGAIPEPATAVLGVIAVASFAVWRKWRR